MSYRSLIIESDSHGRHLAGIVKELVTSETSVLGVVKPGAKLLNITSCKAPTSHSCSILIAGANDLADGQQTTIFRHLEQCIRAKLSSSKVVVATLPHRHDLSVHHQTNKNIDLVNRHIKTIASNYEGVDVVDFNRIGRRLFTSHGMHLRMPGKRLLARLVVESLVRLDVDSDAEPGAKLLSTPPSPRGVVSRPLSSLEPLSSEPITLPYDTFSEAVKRKQSSPLLSATSARHVSRRQETSTDGIDVWSPSLSPHIQKKVAEPSLETISPEVCLIDDLHAQDPSGKRCFLGTPLHTNGLN